MSTTSTHASALRDAIAARRSHVAVIGLGYVGLPLVREFMAKEFPVLGFDVDPTKVDALNAGQSYLRSIPHEMVSTWRASERFEATADTSRLGEAEVILICVPTPLDRYHQPEMRYVDATTEAIAHALRPGQLVVLESTTYPGTTAERIVPRLKQTGLTVGEEVFVAYSPEREDPGNKDFATGTIPKVVGADDPVSRELAELLYSQVVTEVVPVSSAATAEATKLTENIFRAVNIALVNELKMLYDRLEVDVWEVIEAAKTKPFGYMPFYPGPGWGGHCIPIDPFYLSWKAQEVSYRAQFIELAGQINTQMPSYVVEKLTEALNRRKKAVNGSTVLVLGVAYKPNIEDDRESPALPVIEQLKHLGATVRYHDPYVPRVHGFRGFPELDLHGEPELTPQILRETDAVLILTDHDKVDYRAVVEHAELIVDTRNACDGIAGRAEVIKA